MCAEICAKTGVILSPVISAILLATLGGVGNASPADDLDKLKTSLVQICGAGIEKSSSSRLAATIVSRESSASVSLETKKIIRAEIFSSNISDKDAAYAGYLSCVDNLLEKFYEGVSADAYDVVEQVDSNVNYTKNRGLFKKKYQYSANYSLIYKNTGLRTVTCRLTVRGVHKWKSDGDIYNTFGFQEQTFSMAPNGAKTVSGAVGVDGNDDRRLAVSYDKDLSCWY